MDMSNIRSYRAIGDLGFKHAHVEPLQPKHEMRMCEHQRSSSSPQPTLFFSEPWRDTRIERIRIRIKHMFIKHGVGGATRFWMVGDLHRVY
jgi:hypothetical protein